MIGNELFVDGKIVPAHTDKRVRLTNPATEEPIGEVPDSDGVDLDRAVEAARNALPLWKEVPPPERGARLRALADAYDARKSEIAALVTRQNGSVISRSLRTNGARPVATYRNYADLSASFRVEEAQMDGRILIRREPIGVVGAIVPWNAPQSLLAQKLAPALLAGCTVVVKPSPETSLDAYVLAELMDEVGLPPGVVNVLTGGRETGAAMVEHPGVDKISFTGSTAAGRWVAATCGRLLKPVTAELGGKSAAVVLEDADLDVFARSLISTCLPNTGQVCYASTRVLAPRSRFADVVDAVIATLSQARTGDPMDSASEFGPLVSAAQRTRVEEHIQSGIDEGARLLLGGHRPPALPTGYYLEPTVFVDVTSRMRIFREEIFGPVLVIVPYDGDDDAVRVANDSSYGLGGSVFGRDVDRATDIARRMDAGTLAINGVGRPEHTPSYGYKDSGVGGDPGLPAYLQVKSVGRPEC